MFLQKSKRTVKFIIVVVVLGLLLTPVFADLVSKTITVYTGLKVYNDDQLMNLTDASGKTLESFVYNGTTYVPVAAIARAMNKAAMYDRKTQSVYIGAHDSEVPTIMLNQIDFYDGSTDRFFKYDTVKDNMGDFHSNGFCNPSVKTVKRSYMLDGKYRKTKGVFFLGDEDKVTKSSAVLKIYGDGIPLYTSPELKAGMKPIPFEVDITGVISITYEISPNIPKGAYSAYFAIGEVGLYQ